VIVVSAGNITNITYLEYFFQIRQHENNLQSCRVFVRCTKEGKKARAVIVVYAGAVNHHRHVELKKTTSIGTYLLNKPVL
jgi:hypothetical protein